MNIWQIAGLLGKGVGQAPSGLMGLGTEALQQYQAMPSWMEQAAEFAKREPKSLLTDPAYTQFAMGMVGPGMTKSVGPKGITAYHGSPHDFEAFDLNKIGTGEGARAFGHGLYFAENPGTAEYYRNYISHIGTDWNDPVAVAKYLADKHGSREAAIANTRIYPQTDQATRDAIDLLQRGVDLPPRQGRMYQVNIKADPEHFLDWDKPLNQQHQSVQESIKPLLKEFGLEGENLDYLSGTHVLNRMAENLSSGASSSPRVSQLLHEAGIPGIRYLDQGSRGSGQGTHNYVVFDDKLIDIIKKYGLAGLGLPGLAAAGSQDQQ